MATEEKAPQSPTGERQQADDRRENAREGATAGKAKSPTAQGAPEQNDRPDRGGGDGTDGRPQPPPGS
jgi:hypothetical protein